MMKIFSRGGDLELPSKLQWANFKEPALLEWTIKIRDYNTSAANLIFGVLFLTTLIGTGLVYHWSPSGSLPREVMALIFFTVVTISYVSVVFQKVSYAIRLTATGLEYCKWKILPKWMVTIANVLMGVVIVVCIFLASTDPKLLLGALAGAGGIGLMALFKINSKSYQDSQTVYHHHELKWADVTRLVIASNRDVVDLKYAEYTDGDPLPMTGNMNVFCRRKEKHKIAELLLPMLPEGTPCFTAKVNVPMSIDEDYR